MLPIKTMVFTDAICYPFGPVDRDIENLTKEGYSVYIQNSEGIFTKLK